MKKIILFVAVLCWIGCNNAGPEPDRSTKKDTIKKKDTIVVDTIKFTKPL